MSQKWVCWCRQWLRLRIHCSSSERLSDIPPHLSYTRGCNDLFVVTLLCSPSFSACPSKCLVVVTSEYHICRSLTLHSCSSSGFCARRGCSALQRWGTAGWNPPNAVNEEGCCNAIDLPPLRHSALAPSNGTSTSFCVCCRRGTAEPVAFSSSGGTSAGEERDADTFWRGEAHWQKAELERNFQVTVGEHPVSRFILRVVMPCMHLFRVCVATNIPHKRLPSSGATHSSQQTVTTVCRCAIPKPSLVPSPLTRLTSWCRRCARRV